MKLFYLLFLAQLLTIFCYADFPYTIQSIGTKTGDADVAIYQYDKAGNRLVDTVKGQALNYGLIGKPVKITTPNTRTDGIEAFSYGPGGDRYFRVKASGDKIFYINNMEYRIENGSPKSIFYISNGAYSPIVQVDLASSTPTYKYYLQDHQGTTLVNVDDKGTAYNKKHYDSWGLPVAASGVALLPTLINDNHRDFTGHERIKSAELIHANGRVYDPISGFVSPDPALFSGNLVSHNRYAYVLNNGPNHVDPSGNIVIVSIFQGGHSTGYYSGDTSEAVQHRDELVQILKEHFETTNINDELSAAAADLNKFYKIDFTHNKSNKLFQYKSQDNSMKVNMAKFDGTLRGKINRRLKKQGVTAETHRLAFRGGESNSIFIRKAGDRLEAQLVALPGFAERELQSGVGDTTAALGSRHNAAVSLSHAASRADTTDNLFEQGVADLLALRNNPFRPKGLPLPKHMP